MIRERTDIAEVVLHDDRLLDLLEPSAARATRQIGQARDELREIDLGIRCVGSEDDVVQSGSCLPAAAATKRAARCGSRTRRIERTARRRKRDVDRLSQRGTVFTIVVRRERRVGRRRIGRLRLIVVGLL